MAAGRIGSHRVITTMVRAALDGGYHVILVNAETMRGWYAGQDLLGVPGEVVIPESTGFEQVVTTILHTSGLAEAAALTPCPTRCARCAEEAAHTAPRADTAARRSVEDGYERYAQ